MITEVNLKTYAGGSSKSLCWGLNLCHLVNETFDFKLRFIHFLKESLCDSAAALY